MQLNEFAPENVSKFPGSVGPNSYIDSPPVITEQSTMKSSDLNIEMA